MRFFNDREVNIALWDVQVEYYREGSLIDTIVPRSTSGGAGMGFDDVEFWKEESAVFDLSGMTLRSYTYAP